MSLCMLTFPSGASGIDLVMTVTEHERLKMYSFKVESSLIDRLRPIAREDDRSVSSLVRMAIRRLIEEREKDIAGVT